MPKARKSNREAKKQPQMTIKEKRAAKKDKTGDKPFITAENVGRRPTPVPATKRG